MRVLMLYKQKSDHAREIEQFVKDLMKRYSVGKVDLIDVETRDGMSTASLYGVMRYPSVLAVANDGQLIKQWDGENLPLMDEIAYYVSQ